MVLPSRLFAAALAADLSDSAADRRIYLAAAGLALLGVVMTIATAWWWYASRPDDPALGPLEVMSRKRWQAADDAERRQMLAQARPGAAAVPAAEADSGAAPETVQELIDLRQAAAAPVSDFDDLVDDPVSGAAPDDADR